MSRDRKALENDIRDRAAKMLSVYTVHEYQDQIGEWKKYINRVVDAEKAAIDNHQKVLNEMAAAEKTKAEASAMLCMFALSLVTGPLLSWISGAVQYSLVPKLTGVVKKNFVHGKFNQKSFSNGEWITGHGIQPIGYFTEQSHNTITAKIFGDFAKARMENVGSGIMSVFSSSEKQQIKERESRESFQKITSFARQTSSIDQLTISLRTTLEAALDDERELTVKAILAKAMKIEDDQNYGKQKVEDMYKKDPRTRQLVNDSLQWAAFNYVENLVDEERKKWAKEWLYYGCNPPNTSIYEMSRMIEREIWALWILDQDFQIIKYEESKSTREGEVTTEYTKNKGRDKLPFGNILLKRLAYLNITEARNMQELAVNTIHKQQMQSEKFNPVSGIRGTVDEENELNKIKEWAINHPRLTFTSPDNVSFRTIPSIKQYFKQ